MWRGVACLAPSVIAVVLAFSPPAWADESVAPDPASVAAAERRAAEAFQAYAKKEYAVAVDLYLEAYSAAPSSSILYNIARIYDLKLHNRSLAITFYRRYVADPGAQTELIETSNQRLHDLRNSEVTASKAADDSAGGESRVDPRAHPASPGAPDGSQERPGAWSTTRWVGAALGAAGVAGMVVGGGFGLAAMSQANTAKGLCDGNACTSQQGVDAAHTARTDALFSTIGFAGGGALLVTGAALFFLGVDRSVEQPGVHLEAYTSASQASLQVVGRW
jgi:hypothetical protein